MNSQFDVSPRAAREANVSPGAAGHEDRGRRYTGAVPSKRIPTIDTATDWAPMRREARWLRTLDVAGAVMVLAVSWAPLLVAAGLIRLCDGRDALFRQRRVGKGGRTFVMYKLRTMAGDAEETWASAQDPRVTRVGRWLRRTRLDEVPQCFNVLRGEMSMVGPRPETPSIDAALREQLGPRYAERQAVLPGITGLAQLEVGYVRTTADARRRLDADLEYIAHSSPAFNLRLLCRTIPFVLMGRGT